MGTIDPDQGPDPNLGLKIIGEVMNIFVKKVDSNVPIILAI